MKIVVITASNFVLCLVVRISHWGGGLVLTECRRRSTVRVASAMHPQSGNFSMVLADRVTVTFRNCYEHVTVD
jgi:hypothetical protein